MLPLTTLSLHFYVSDGILFRRSTLAATGKTRNKGYMHVDLSVGGKRHRMPLHRVLMTLVLERDLSQGEVIDHINGDRLDNRIENLRVVDKLTNARNTENTRESGYVAGVGIYRKCGIYRVSVKRQRGKREHVLYTSCLAHAELAVVLCDLKIAQGMSPRQAALYVRRKMSAGKQYDKDDSVI